ncbi:MAG: porin family protein [Bacteroidales bacterium]|nr:porin family protein [Bacteroidales bacterium]
MKKINLVIVIILSFILSIDAFSQNLSLGAKGGLNLSNMIVKYDDETLSDDFKMLAGFHVYPFVEYSFSDLFAIDAGLNFQSRGYSFEGDIVKGRYTTLYLDIPINAKFNFDLGSVKLFCNVGPYVAFGIGGTVYTETNIGSLTTTARRDIDWGDDLKSTDFGLNIGVGLDINNFIVGLNYGGGIANLYNIHDYDNRAYNYVLSLSIGYKFNL